MRKIASMAEDGQIDAAKLGEDSNEFLQMYLDNQVRCRCSSIEVVEYVNFFDFY
jgi:hypothetical protein